MKDKIFVHIGHHLGLMQASTLPTSAPGEEEYIRKEAILEWAKDRLDKSVTQIVQLAMKSVIDKIESL